ncbi:flap endonuclease GEN [Cylas formicarius]|uniref:flap endonuclease GEN n=1 Tax=Cylas formicarius TaxID=197179 RepID=UPI002958C5E9|nr:flap endonuclease GEN [Cylas formicarius]
MGIKNLWTILTPFCDRKPLYELQGKTVAVDLSCWICEAQNIAEYQVQPRMYLRNLYFRTCFLLLMDVSPVFVLEGKAPELKYDTIAARNAIQFKGAKPKTDGVKTGKDRSRFHFVLKQCEQMLKLLGVACIKGNGEAESLCAYLNEDGLVDGCISQDSDCFAYGARVVYRNFSISAQGGNAASGGAVDIYDIGKAFEGLKLGRNKIVAMALLVGSDYSDGVRGVGKDSVMKFFETVSDDEVLDRLRSWRDDELTYAKYERRLNDKNICTSCGHGGKVQGHSKNGCKSCGTTRGCDPFKYKEERSKMKNEVAIRTKAMQVPNFPDEALIEEYLARKDNVSALNLKWTRPDVANFITFAIKFLQWEGVYAFDKILPVLTRWQCRNPDLRNIKGTVLPSKIKKARNPKGVPSYEVLWSDPEGHFEGLIPQKQLDAVNTEKLWSTVEPKGLMEQAYPELVQQYEQSKVKPRKTGKRKNKNGDDVMVKKTRKPRVKKGPVGELELSFSKMSVREPKLKTLESFLKRATNNAFSTPVKGSGEVQVQFDVDKALSTPVKVFEGVQPTFDPDMSGFGDEDDLEVSDIVGNIVSKRKFDCVDRVIEKYASELGDPSDCRAVLDGDVCAINSSSFFMSNPAEENDLFERTFHVNLDTSSGDETEEYEVDERQFEGGESEVKLNGNCSSDDSFCEEKYVPLYQRLQLK